MTPSVLLSRKSFASCQGFSSAGSWERTHPACRVSDTQGPACGTFPRTEPPRSLRLCLENRRSAGFQSASADVYILRAGETRALLLVRTSPFSCAWCAPADGRLFPKMASGTMSYTMHERLRLGSEFR